MEKKDCRYNVSLFFAFFPHFSLLNTLFIIRSNEVLHYSALVFLKMRNIFHLKSPRIVYFKYFFSGPHQHLTANNSFFFFCPPMCVLLISVVSNCCIIINQDLAIERGKATLDEDFLVMATWGYTYYYYYYYYRALQRSKMCRRVLLIAKKIPRAPR